MSFYIFVFSIERSVCRLSGQLVAMSEKQAWKFFAPQELNFQFLGLNFQFLEGNFKMSEPCVLSASFQK